MCKPFLPGDHEEKALLKVGLNSVNRTRLLYTEGSRKVTFPPTKNEVSFWPSNIKMRAPL